MSLVVVSMRPTSPLWFNNLSVYVYIYNIWHKKTMLLFYKWLYICLYLVFGWYELDDILGWYRRQTSVSDGRWCVSSVRISVTHKSHTTFSTAPKHAQARGSRESGHAHDISAGSRPSCSYSRQTDRAAACVCWQSAGRLWWWLRFSVITAWSVRQTDRQSERDRWEWVTLQHPDGCVALMSPCWNPYSAFWHEKPFASRLKVCMATYYTVLHPFIYFSFAKGLYFRVVLLLCPA